MGARGRAGQRPLKKKKKKKKKKKRRDLRPRFAPPWSPPHPPAVPSRLSPRGWPLEPGVGGVASTAASHNGSPVVSASD